MMTEPEFIQPKPRMVTVRRQDLDTLMWHFDHPGDTALGSRPFRRLREVLASEPDKDADHPEPDPDLVRAVWAAAEVTKARCVVCEGDIFWQDCPTGGWWIHRRHPADGHDARPQEPNAPVDPPSAPVQATKPPAGTSGHPDPGTALQERRARYEGAIVAIVAMPHHTRQLIAHASMVLADVELADIEAMAADNLRLFEMQVAKVHRLRVDHARFVDNRVRQANALIDERDEARATIERVRELVDAGWLVSVDDIRAALGAPTEPAPDLEVGREHPSPTPDGSGTWLAPIPKNLR